MASPDNAIAKNVAANFASGVGPAEAAAAAVSAASQFSVANNNIEDYGVQRATGYAPAESAYQMIITQVGNNDKTVVANAPLEFDLTVQNNFVDLSTLFEATPAFGTASSSRSASSAGFLAATASVYNQARVATFQIWGGTTPMQFPVQLTFKAYSDPMKDVINPVRNLLWMASPDGQNTFLNSPGPSLVDAFKAISGNGNFFTSLNKSIIVRQGRFVLAGLVIEALQLKISPRAERRTGLPMAIEAMLTFKTVTSYSRQELFSAFYGSNFNVSNLSSNQSRQ